MRVGEVDVILLAGEVGRDEADADLGDGDPTEGADALGLGEDAVTVTGLLGTEVLLFGDVGTEDGPFVSRGGTRNGGRTRGSRGWGGFGSGCGAVGRAMDPKRNQGREGG